MKELSEKFDDLGYDLLGLENLSYLGLEEAPGCSGGSCNGGCSGGCHTCKPNCSSGP